MARTIQHPGVEINEIDISQVAPAIAGTQCLVMGFADRGEEATPFEFTSRNSFLNYYGQPTNEAEYYFYDAANEILQQNGGLIAARIPYLNSARGKFKQVKYKVISGKSFASSPLISTQSASAQFFSLSAENLSGFNKIQKVGAQSVGETVVDGYRTGTKPGNDTFVIVAKNREKLDKDSREREINGLFTTVVTPYNAFANQGVLSFITAPSGLAASSVVNPFVGWNNISYIQDPAGNNLSGSSFDFTNPISGADFQKPSLAKTLGNLFPTLQVDTNGRFESYLARQILVAVCRTFEDTNEAGKTGVQILETFVGSLNATAINDSTGESIFIEDIINENSDFIEFYAGSMSNLASEGFTYKASEIGSPLLGFKEIDTARKITQATILSGMSQILTKVENIDETTIDVVVDAGLSSIGNMINNVSEFDPTSAVTSPTNTQKITKRSDCDNWRSIATEMVEFCKDKRKDCIAVIDGPRNLVLEGNQKIERSTAPTQQIDIDILPKLKFLTGINSSYGTANIMWMKGINEFTGETIYLPPSNKVAGVMVFTDRVYNYWDAPAGFTRGRVFGVNDIAFNPNPEQQDIIYGKNFNYAKNYPIDGIIIEGQKTLQTRESAFDRVNVRRLFLRLERLTYNVLRYFVYEPNNFFTRTQIVDILTPVFENVKVQGGLFDYRIICSEKNNTADVIDRNELKIAIMLKPTRTAEFILADFYALRTGASFNEVIL
jgi:hypothetical protein